MCKDGKCFTSERHEGITIDKVLYADENSEVSH
jgi:hypothetical protein